MSIPEPRPETGGASQGEPRPREEPDVLASAALRRRLVARALDLPETAIAAVALRGVRRRFGRDTAFLRATLGDDERRDLIAKLYDGSEGADAFRIGRALESAGMAPPAVATVPRVHAYLRTHRVLVMEHAPGRSWLEAACDGEVAASSRRAADWLLALQRLGEPATASGTLRTVLAAQPVGAAGAAQAKELAVALHCRELAERLPDLALRLAPWPQRLGPALGAAGLPPGPSHGDFHPGNLLIARGRTTAVDLDGLALREPAYDAGSAVAQLLAMTDLQDRGVALGAAAAGAFWKRLRDGTSAATVDRLDARTSLHALATLLAVLHYSFRMETRRRDLAHRWLPGLEAWWKARDEGLLAGLARFEEAVA